MKRTVILVILDGWGIGENDESNPIYLAKPQFIDYAKTYFPFGALKASGISIGLPWEEPGNSEVGHLTIGAGRVLYQHYPKISTAILDKTFFENNQLKKAFTHAKDNNSAVHLIGLLTSGSVHAHLSHLLALIEMAKKENCKELYLHLITDGRDSAPRSALTLLKKVQEKINECRLGVVVSIMGRFYAMNRDGSWDRIEKAYNSLFGDAPIAPSFDEVIKKSYDKKLDDEYLEPTILNPSRPIKDNDTVIFFNFREDGARELIEPFINMEFNVFPTKNPSNLFIVTMTPYLENIETNVAFPNEKIENPLSKVLSENGKTQLRLAESEKYAHVTYFFNGLTEQPFNNEYRVIIPSRKEPRPENHPEMMADAVTERAMVSLEDGGFDFILINYANPDVIAHTGDFKSTLKAIQTIDKLLTKLIRKTLDRGHIMIVTSDHGNAESLLSLKTGEVETSHNSNPVPFFIFGHEFQHTAKKIDPLDENTPIGILSDIAPTILEIMKIPKPKDMTGESLLNQLS